MGGAGTALCLEGRDLGREQSRSDLPTVGICVSPWYGGTAWGP